MMDLRSPYMLLHLVTAVIWVGGMFFAYVCLRPVAAQQLEPPQRLQLWVGVFNRFFPYVWISIILLPITGYLFLRKTWFGFGDAPLYVNLMTGIGIVMVLLFMHVYFAPFKRLKEAVAIQDWQAGGKQLNQIRKLIGINLSLGLLLIALVGAGRFFDLLK